MATHWQGQTRHSPASPDDIVRFFCFGIASQCIRHLKGALSVMYPSCRRCITWTFQMDPFHWTNPVDEHAALQTDLANGVPKGWYIEPFRRTKQCLPQPTAEFCAETLAKDSGPMTANDSDPEWLQMHMPRWRWRRRSNCTSTVCLQTTAAWRDDRRSWLRRMQHAWPPWVRKPLCWLN